MDFGTNSDYFPIQHQLTGFYNRDGVCLLRGTDWVFKYVYFLSLYTQFVICVWGTLTLRHRVTDYVM